MIGELKAKLHMHFSSKFGTLKCKNRMFSPLFVRFLFSELCQVAAIDRLRFRS